MNLLLASMMKPNYLRHPMWRWTTAFQCLVDPGLSVEQALRMSRAGRDPWLEEACSFYSKRQAANVRDPMTCMIQHPAMHEAYLIFSDTKEGGFRWMLEAMLMTGEPYDQIAKVFNPLHGEKTVEMYEKVFFDISHYRKNRACVMCAIIAAGLNVNDRQHEADVTWKTFAYDQGFDAFQEFISFRTGGLLSVPILHYMQQASRQRRIYHEYHVTRSFRGVMNQEGLQILDQADRRFKLERDSAGDSPETEEGSKVLKTVLGALQESMTPSVVGPQIDANKGRFTEPGMSARFSVEQALLDKAHRKLASN